MCDARPVDVVEMRYYAMQCDDNGRRSDEKEKKTMDKRGKRREMSLEAVLE
jgi:hypothetical protein